MEEVLCFYKNLSTSNSSKMDFAGVELSPISDYLAKRLVRLLDETEKRKAVFECDGNKAPSLDGYSMKFLQHNFDLLCEDLLKVFQEFHQNGVIKY